MTDINVISLLAKSAEKGRGREFHASQIKEIVTIMQGMQFQIASDQGRSDALTRVLAVALNQLGGAIDIEPDLFVEAENYIVNVQWDEEDEGAIIHATLQRTNVDVPSVQEDTEAASDDTTNVVPVQEPEDQREDSADSDDSDDA